MKRYKIVYGGQAWVEAASEEEAYERFFQIIRERIEAKALGLIVESYALEDDGDAADESHPGA